MKIVLVPLLALAGLATAGLVVGRFAERPETSVDCALPRHAWLPACLEAGPRPAAEPAATGSLEAAARRSTLPSEKPPPEPEPERAEASASEAAPEQDG
ncbi:MAG TPA: hypothetical protein VM434_12245, partial [Beijerinckiaceae bacterium]|nr:hypothetical protein [Beijerinckiaceae bacterium]